MNGPRPRRPIRGVIVDVDGTLTIRGKGLQFEAARRLSELDERGIPVVIATGNVLPIALALHRFLSLRSPIVAENGGLVYYPEGKVVHLGKKDVAFRAFEELRAHLDVHPLFTDRWRETEVALEPTHSLEEIRPWIEKTGAKVEHTGMAIHLFAPTAGKLPAVRMALEPLGISVEDCLVAGDGGNDVELLQGSSLGVSFPDAMPEAIAAADYVTRSNDGEGLIEALKRFLGGPSQAPNHRKSL